MARHKTKTRAQVEAMQDKAVRFLNDVADKPDLADDIEDMSVEEYARHKHITISNPHGQCKQYADKCVPRSQMAWAPGNDVSKWKLRIDNASHVRDAMARFGHTQGIPRGKRKAVARIIVRAGDRFGIDSANFQRKHLGRVLPGTPKRRRRVRNAARLGSGTRFKHLEHELAERPGVEDPEGLAAWIGRRKYGKRRFEQMSERGRRRRNPDAALQEAEGLYREFHGRGPDKVMRMQKSEAQRGTYTALGELWELDFKAPSKEKIRLSFEGNRVKLASSPDGNQLYLIGGDQRMEENLLRQFGAEGEKDFVTLGEATSITYVTRKSFDGFKEAGYVHKFGEEGGYRPEGFYNRLQRTIVLAGGSYHIEAPGIIN